MDQSRTSVNGLSISDGVPPPRCHRNRLAPRPRSWLALAIFWRLSDPQGSSSGPGRDLWPSRIASFGSASAAAWRSLAGAACSSRRAASAGRPCVRDALAPGESNHPLSLHMPASWPSPLTGTRQVSRRTLAQRGPRLPSPVRVVSGIPAAAEYPGGAGHRARSLARLRYGDPRRHSRKGSRGTQRRARRPLAGVL